MRTASSAEIVSPSIPSSRALCGSPRVQIATDGGVAISTDSRAGQAERCELSMREQQIVRCGKLCHTAKAATRHSS